MFSSLYIGSSGLAAYSYQLSVVSNNIANSETTAFKSSDANFADILNRSIARPWGTTTGSGVIVQSVKEVWTQGGITGTGISTDLAINGNGFFVVGDPATEELYYTRDGSFGFDEEGYLRAAGGEIVQGYAFSDSGALGAMTDVLVSYEYSSPKETTEMSMTMNLDADAAEGDTFTNTVTVYDSLGNDVSVTVIFTKSATANEWEWSASIPGEDGTIGTPSTGTLAFDSDGNLVSGTDPALTLNLTNGAATQTINWNMYDDTGASSGLVTQYATDSTVTSQTQDGYPAGEMSKITIDENGVVSASYTNGESNDLFQLALANFNDLNGLEKVDGNLYMATTDSGEPLYGVANTGRFGEISSGALENSNVNLATEMTTMISAQSAYQACSKVITTTDEMIQALLNMT